ncbi:proteasome assembly chaperone family protein [Desulfurococcaceae archaeon MEX13E-LK6-19]|nr:proteasome assembly chaperone family protein [Desulfurococcaceae archaeon MEX13E-LK6-19]
MVSHPIRKHVLNDIEIYEYVEPRLKHPAYLVLGLPDAGLVGALATKYLTTKIETKMFAEIDSSKYFQPVSVIHNASPMSPFRIYINNDGNVLALVAEAPLPVPSVYPVAKTIVEYASLLGVDYIISLSGIAAPNRLEIEKPKAYWIATTDDAAELMKKTGLETLNEGFVVGPYAVILKEAKRKGLRNIAIFVESFLDFPDPEASAEALKALSSITGVTIDVSKLLEEAELIKLQARELMKQTKKAMMQMQKNYEMQMPLMYT